LIYSIDPVGSQITTGTEIAGHSWNLWSGPNQNWHVYSFVSAAGNINSFDADLNDFFREFSIYLLLAADILSIG
jgi:xyloglucan-specific endo-beta-1,4-glucanase